MISGTSKGGPYLVYCHNTLSSIPFVLADCGGSQDYNRQFQWGTFTGVSSGFCLHFVCVACVKAAKTVKLCACCCCCCFKTHSQDLKLSNEGTEISPEGVRRIRQGHRCKLSLPQHTASPSCSKIGGTVPWNKFKDAASPGLETNLRIGS